MSKIVFHNNCCREKPEQSYELRSPDNLMSGRSRPKHTITGLVCADHREPRTLTACRDRLGRRRRDRISPPDTDTFVTLARFEFPDTHGVGLSELS